MENILLTIINDGDGSICGLNYDQRCALAEDGYHDCLKAAILVAKKHGGTRLEALRAAIAVQRYYQQHMLERTQSQEAAT